MCSLKGPGSKVDARNICYCDGSIERFRQTRNDKNRERKCGAYATSGIMLSSVRQFVLSGFAWKLLDHEMKFCSCDVKYNNDNISVKKLFEKQSFIQY